MDSRTSQVSVLGSTGSVGANTLDVIARHPDRFKVFALTASTRVDEMLQQCLAFQPVFAVMASEPQGRLLEAKCKDLGLQTRVLWGAAALEFVAAHDQVDIVMAAIVGAAGLAPCLGAARAGKRLLLANKEALVVGGKVFMQTVKDGGAVLLPIDSEHSAIFQSLPDDASTWAEKVDKIILTASGGPFRTRDPSTLHNVTPEQACAHPNWVMGKKISVDSATMMNKALEVVEAHFLFGVAPNQLEVVIHPQSVIHSMVQFKDNSVVAQLGTPDMRGPIAYGLAWPDRVQCGTLPIDFANLGSLTFEGLNTNDHGARFPGLNLAWSALRGPEGTTAILNAANEMAVAAFLTEQLRFDQIYHVIVDTLESVSTPAPQCLGDLLELDAESRAVATQAISRMAR